MRIVHLVGARPNFMKIAPILDALRAHVHVQNVLVHSGQHYDTEMSATFFAELSLPEPDVNLGVGSGSHTVQTAEVMRALEPILLREKPDVLVVVGDVNSTMAGALVAAKMNVPVAHVEAGLRSRDRSMPEEINRLVTDQIASLLLTPSRDADLNLANEGIPADRIHFVGNVMVDTLLRHLDRARGMRFPERHGLGPRDYFLATLHRPTNVDDPRQLREIFAAFDELGRDTPLLFPLHPRTRRSAETHGLRLEHVRTLPPLGYLEMLGLMAEATLVLTDSGGVQEETTALGVPCLTLRDSTERPITVTEGTNSLVPERTRENILRTVSTGISKRGRIPELWDGKTGLRIASSLVAWSPT